MYVLSDYMSNTKKNVLILNLTECPNYQVIVWIFMEDLEQEFQDLQLEEENFPELGSNNLSAQLTACPNHLSNDIKPRRGGSALSLTGSGRKPLLRKKNRIQSFQPGFDLMIY